MINHPKDKQNIVFQEIQVFNMDVVLDLYMFCLNYEEKHHWKLDNSSIHGAGSVVSCYQLLWGYQGF